MQSREWRKMVAFGHLVTRRANVGLASPRLASRQSGHDDRYEPAGAGLALGFEIAQHIRTQAAG